MGLNTLEVNLYDTKLTEESNEDLKEFTKEKKRFKVRIIMIRL